ncbi:MAG: SUMF1/EgtB/PvdO family nonheme iron enzyme, partial [Planctomycetota bacterium]|nr:SUMF1/EgtB/PvdO family nonheme iron enzyme [Planctomycetota bacterium]
ADRAAPMSEIGREPPFPPSVMESAMEEAAPPAAVEGMVKESPAEPPEVMEIPALGLADREAWGLRARAIPSGEYEVGTTEMEINRRVSSEFPNPLRKVSLPAMEISEFEVTNDEYVLFVEAGGYDLQEYWSEEAWRRIDEFRTEDSEARAPRFWPEGRPPERRGSYPVVGIGFDEAVAYCAWLSGLHPDLAGARLPTEEEWEVAASWDRSKGRKLKYPWGDGWLEGRANICTGEPLPVGSSSFDRSTFGCQDMAGNVREWVTGKLGRPVLKGACFLPMIAPETMARSEWHLAPRESDNFRYRRSDFTGFRVVLPSRPAVSPGQEQDE